MPNILKDLFTSKKFIFTLLTTVLLIGGAAFGAISKEEAEHFLIILWPVYLGAQGLADVGDKMARAKLDIHDGESANKNQVLGVLNQGLPLVLKAFGVEATDPKASAIAAAFDGWLRTLNPNTFETILKTLSPAELNAFKVAIALATELHIHEAAVSETPAPVTEPSAASPIPPPPVTKPWVGKDP